MTALNENDSFCCPLIDPGQWDNQTFNWTGKQFILGKVRTFFYMPLNFGKVMKRLDKKVRAAGATMPEWLCLSDHTSKWNMDVYLAVDREIPGAENTTLSGKFYGKVYEGPFSDTGKWCKDYESHVKSIGWSVIKWYMWYTTCPKCAKKYGKNDVVILSEVS
jgi:hypothetical protein